MIFGNGKCLDIPIIQGGMGVGVSLGNLAGNVAACGAMGVISSVNAGYREDDFEKSPFEANIHALRKEIRKAFCIANENGMVALNVMVAVNHYDETIKAAVEEGIEAIISGAGLPLHLPELVKGTDTLIAPIVSSGKAANVICKSWDNKYNVIPDFIVIEGPKAGGVFDGKDMAEYIKEGASGVQIATRFIATEECDASEEYKKMMLEAREDDVTIIKSPVGMPGRAIRSNLIQKLDNGDTFPPITCNLCLKACPHGNKTPYCISRALIEAVKGNKEDGLFFCGANVGRIKEIVTVRELINEIVDEWRKNS